MTEEIYIDGSLMDADAGRTNVQLLFQSPILTDFQSITSNRTSSVTLPLTQHNLAAIGYLGTQADSVYPYRKHSVVYKRDGVQLLSGIATLLSVGSSTLSFCFTWGNVQALETLFATSLRELGGANEEYSVYPPNNALNPSHVIEVNYGGGRKGVGVKVADVLTRIESKCGVTGLAGLADANEDGSLEYALALTTRNGDTHTRALQGVSLGYPMGLSNWEASTGNWFTALKQLGGSDPHGWMNSNGIVDTSGAEKVRIHMEGSFAFMIMTSTPYTPIGLRLLYNTGDGWYIAHSTMLQEATPISSNTYEVDIDYDETFDASGWEACCLCVMYDSVQAGVNVITSSLMSVNDIILDPDKEDDVMYNIGTLNTYPVYRNLPDMTCGQFVKNLLWLHGAFAYSKDGRELQIVTFNDIMERKAQAVDWTDKFNGRPTERQYRLEGTAQRNLFRYAEADYYDNTQYQGELETEDETIAEETEYCKSDFAIAPGNLIPAWTNNDGQWDYTEYPCCIIVTPGIRKGKYYTLQDWRNILIRYYEQYAKIVRRPVVLKGAFILSTYDLYALDLITPVYLRQTGHYYLIRTITTKGGGLADVELIQI